MPEVLEFIPDALDGPDILHNYHLITEPDDVAQVAQILDRAGKFSLDLETDGLDHKRNNIHGIALATGDQEFYVTLDATNTMLEPLKDLAQRSLMVGHNWPFDLHFLWKHGVRPQKIFDTMIAQFLVDENQELGLKPLGRTKLGHRDLPDFKSLMHLGKFLTHKARLEDVNIYDMPLEKVARYAARDARMTYDLMPISEHELAQEGMTDIFWNTEMPFIFVLTDMEESGFYIDQELLASLGAEFSQIRDDALARFLDISGGINPASPQQLAKYFYETLGYEPTVFTGKNAPSTDALAIGRLIPIDKTGAAEALQTYRKYEKLIGTYITAFRDKMVNGWLYGHFNQLGGENNDATGRLPRTGRLNSSGPNLQNIPARGELGARIRELFAAPPGWLFLDCDYSQLEMRIAAHYTRDPNLMKVFEENGDPHQMTADLCSVPRYIAKSLNFGTLYGVGPRKFGDTVEKTGQPRPTFDESKGYLNAFDRAYPAIKRWKERVVEYARELGYVRTIAGRRRRLPDLRSRDNALRSAAERQGPNAIIQGSASDIIKYAMIQMHPIIKSTGALLTAQVHDEVTALAQENVASDVMLAISEKMVEAGKHFNLRVQLVAEAHSGKNWAQTH